MLTGRRHPRGRRPCARIPEAKMPRKLRRPKARREPAPQYLIDFLLTGELPSAQHGRGQWHCFDLTGPRSRGRLRELWLAHRSDVLRQCPAGRRPWAEWEFEADEAARPPG